MVCRTSTSACDHIIIKTDGDYCTNKMQNLPDNFPEVLCEMLGNLFCLVEFSVEFHSLVMVILIFWID